MWHFKTHFGVIWLISEDDKYFLGIDQDALGTFNSSEDAVTAVNNHVTGHKPWDNRDKIRVPQEIAAWQVGEPECW